MNEHEEFEKRQVECLNTFIKPKKTNFDVLNEFVKKTFGFELDKSILKHQCINLTTKIDCQILWGIPMCQGCQYKDFWSLEYKEEK